MPWQRRALDYVDQIPELSYASRFYSRMLRQLRLYPAILDEDDQPQAVTDPEAISILDRVRDPGGGRTQIQGNYGRLSFITGEGTLFGAALETPDERWSYVWNDELEIVENRGSIERIIHMPQGTSGPKTEYGPDEAVAYRMWTSHPRLSGEADSPMRAALDVAEELIVLTQAVRATAVSRTTNGVLFLPLEGAPPPAEVLGDEDPESDPFMSDFVEHLIAQKENAGTAEAAAPYVVWMAAELIQQGVRYERIHDTANDYAERELRKEAVERLAHGLDFPPEVLQGLGSTNHWAAMQILQDMWRSHGIGAADQWVHDLNLAYYRPALLEAGVDRADSIVIAYDASKIEQKVDRSEDADKALDRGAIGYQGYRILKGIPEKWAATDDDLAQMERVKSLGKSREATPARDPSADGPPPQGAEGDSGRRTRVVASRESGAALMAIYRCREMAGNRIRNKARGRVPISDDVPPAQVAAALGAEKVIEVCGQPRDLVSGGSESFGSAMRAWGYSPAETEALCEAIELFAARTLTVQTVTLPGALEARINQIAESTDEAA